VKCNNGIQARAPVATRATFAFQPHPLTRFCTSCSSSSTSLHHPHGLLQTKLSASARPLPAQKARPTNVWGGRFPVWRRSGPCSIAGPASAGGGRQWSFHFANIRLPIASSALLSHQRRARGASHPTAPITRRRRDCYWHRHSARRGRNEPRGVAPSSRAARAKRSHGRHGDQGGRPRYVSPAVSGSRG
jgi:hypothetical protein